MRPSRAVLVAALFATSLVGCGPVVSESRTTAYPGREESCKLEFVKLDNATLSGGGEWEVIGQVAIGGLGSADPFSEKSRAIVRPRACRMGGEAVGIFQVTNTETFVNTGSTTTYAVLRHRSTTPQEPQAF